MKKRFYGLTLYHNPHPFQWNVIVMFSVVIIIIMLAGAGILENNQVFILNIRNPILLDKAKIIAFIDRNDTYFIIARKLFFVSLGR